MLYWGLIECERYAASKVRIEQTDGVASERVRKMHKLSAREETVKEAVPREDGKVLIHQKMMGSYGQNPSTARHRLGILPKEAGEARGRCREGSPFRWPIRYISWEG